MLKIGTHVSFKADQYLVGAVEEALSYGSNVMMIYLGPPQNTKRVNVEKYNYQEYLEKYKNIIQSQDIIVHAPYIVNPASPEKWEFAYEFLVAEIKRMNYIGAKYLVLHPGAYTKFPKEQAIKTLINTIKKIISATENVEILLETMAGKGTEIGANFLELNEIIQQINSPRVNICLDTCHVWESGVDIKNTKAFINQLKQHNLLKKVKVFHINDSKNPQGHKRDRHANIDQGYIGLEALKNIIFHPFFQDIPMILETPWVNNKPIYKQEILMIKNAQR